MTLLVLDGVGVAFGDADPVIHGVSYSVGAGEVVAVVGESGSGKTVTAMSLLGLLPATAHVTGRATLAGRDLYTLPPAELREVRGGTVGMVFQEPMSALNPVFTIGFQLTEAVLAHRAIPAAQARARAVELLELVGIPAAAARFGAYPHELSGGQLQRVVIAMAVANEPTLLIADEPTTALDVTVQAEILELLRALRERLGTAVLLITHDMGVVADLADRVVVMRDGRVVEQGGVAEIFGAPQQEYTRELLAAAISLSGDSSADTGSGHVAVADHPATTSVPDTPVPDAVLTVQDLVVVYRGRFGGPGLRAADGVRLHVGPREILGLVGESGSGKSTVAGVVNGLIAPTAGQVLIGGTDVAGLRGRAARELRRRVGVVFQDPLSSLNPRATVRDSIAEPFRLHRVLDGPELDRRIDELLSSVQLTPALRGRYPHELSGGQRQRVCIARALALDPQLIVADEPTSALDVSVQARILDLLRELQAQHGFACLFISHDLAVIEQLADRVAVMHRGHIVEQGPTDAVLSAPRHPYTRHLLAAAPVADPGAQRLRRAAWRELQETG